MYKLSIRLVVTILTFVVGIFAVAGWFYCQESQKFRVIVPNAHRDSILFSGVDERGGINHVTKLVNIKGLREIRLKNDDIEVRIWRSSSLEGVFLKRIAGQWSGLHIKPNGYYKAEKVEIEQLNSPKSGWESFWKQLIDKEILTLPQSTENKCDISTIDGTTYVVEINQYRTYRTYYYPEGNDKICREAKQMKEIGEFIGLEFDSGREQCKTTEWFPCMTFRKSRGK